MNKIRHPAVYVLYLLVFLQWHTMTGGQAVNELPPWWPFQTAALILFACGAFALYSFKPLLPGWTIVFGIKAFFFVVILFPLGNSLFSYYLLFTILTAEAVSTFPERRNVALLLTGAALLFILLLPHRTWGHETSVPGPGELAVLAFWTGACAYLFSRSNAFEQRESEHRKETARYEELIDQVYRLNSDFQTYAAAAGEKSAIEERKRITRDIHDIMGYSLVNLRVMLEVAVDLAGDSNPKLSAMLADAAEHTRESLSAARAALRNLRSVEESETPWTAKVRSITGTFSRATGIEVSVNMGNVTLQNCPRANGAVYQFLQEAMTNSFKHGKARCIRVDFRIERGKLKVRAADDGRGTRQVIPGIGLSGMQERMNAIGGVGGYGNLADGFEVWIEIPLGSLTAT